MTELHARDAWDLADAIRRGEITSTEVVDAHLARIEAINPRLNAMAYLDAESARARAAEIDAEIATGADPGPFAGVPLGVKELAQAEGLPDTHASMLYRDELAAHDCAEVARLRAAGAVVVGLTTAPEFGIPSFTNSPLHGVTRNPWNLERTPGGSSGGSAAAVSSGMLPFCTGSDGGGSIRIPSSYSGLPGLKSTFGRIGSGPDAAFDAGLTSVHGPMVRSVRDAARYIDVTAGPTLTDPTSLPKPEPYEPMVVSGTAGERLRAKRVAWSSTLGYGVVDPEVESVVLDAAHALVDGAGMEWVDVDVVLPKPGRAWGLLGAPNMAAWHLDDATGREDELDFLARASFEGMPRLRARHLGAAVQRRQELLLATAGLFSEIDVLLTPTTATTAFAAEGVLSGEVDGREVDLMILSAAFTAPFNMTGQPGCSIPAGLVGDMPVALQAVGRRHEDDLTLACAAVLEEIRPWPKFAPGYEHGVPAPALRPAIPDRRARNGPPRPSDTLAG
ncbi:MAG TPA: amidase [Acidimicrobiia bacterium]|nr:amidase [Acidimicrobiia bacterium]